MDNRPTTVISEEAKETLNRAINGKLENTITVDIHAHAPRKFDGYILETGMDHDGYCLYKSWPSGSALTLIARGD